MFKSPIIKVTVDYTAYNRNIAAHIDIKKVVDNLPIKYCKKSADSLCILKKNNRNFEFIGNYSQKDMYEKTKSGSDLIKAVEKLKDGTYIVNYKDNEVLYDLTKKEFVDKNLFVDYPKFSENIDRLFIDKNGNAGILYKASSIPAILAITSHIEILMVEPESPTEVGIELTYYLLQKRLGTNSFDSYDLDKFMDLEYKYKCSKRSKEIVYSYDFHDIEKALLDHIEFSDSKNVKDEINLSTLIETGVIPNTNDWIEINLDKYSFYGIISMGIKDRKIVVVKNYYTSIQEVYKMLDMFKPEDISIIETNVRNGQWIENYDDLFN
ncbi:MAG: hypothetical protein BV456_12420 [Thermoplasmata archaeon M8B2D]|nr:MAG: hypothetical protein BV456_12420 [Thermoplasmata archaeon M8B2D]